MKTLTPCLQASDIEALLAGTVPPSQSRLWEEHFSGCEGCRQTMANQIGDQQWWNEAEQSLKLHVGESLRDSHVRLGETDLRETDLHESCVEPESIEELLRLLGPTDDPQMLGRIGSYEVLGVLGRGGMGVVFKAFDAPLNRFVAIKMLLPHLAASGGARKRFAREGQAVAAVVDDHVMAIHCVDEWQGVPYLVMTYSRGVSLQKRLSDNGPLEVREILRIGMQTAKGLAAAHAQGIVHRDIKPANIFLDQTVERVQLMDFGLARAVDDASLTRTGVLAGTPQYMSPEQARAETVDHRSDLFSLGSVMYAMCTGHAPFRAESSYSVLRLITDKEPRPIREINPDVPEWLCAIITKLMAKQASERYQSAKELSDLLEDCLAHVQQPAAMPLPTAVAALAPKQTRHPPIGKFIAAAAFAFSLLFAGVMIVLELNKGMLTIQSDSDDVRVRITQGDEVIDELKVSKSGQSVRVAAGNYKVEIIGETDDLVVENAQVTLHRAGTEVVKIVHNAHSHMKDQTSVASAKEETTHYPVLEAHPEQVDLSTPQSTLKYIDQCKVNNPAHVPVDCYTEDALLEMSGVMLQQLGYMTVLSRIYSHVDTQIRIQTRDVSNGKDIGPTIPGGLLSFHLQVDALFKEHSLAMPPEQCKKALELLLKSTVVSLDGKETRVIPDRQLYRLAAGTLKSPKEFLPQAGKLSQFFRDSSRDAASRGTEANSEAQYDIVIHGTEATATAINENGKLATPMKFKLRRVNQRWLVSEEFSDEILKQINLSMPQMTVDVPAIKTEGGSQPLLDTWEQVHVRLSEIVKERAAIANAEVDFKLDSDGEHNSKRRYHVWLNDLFRRADCRGASSDGAEDYTHIVTPDFSWYDDHLNKNRSQMERHDPKDPVGWGTLGCIVDVRKVGLVNWSIESIDTYEFDHDLLPKDRIETSVETGDYEGAPITIVKHRLKSTDATERWTEYWLSPKHGNYPIYIANGWTEPGNPPLKNIVSQRTQWDFLDGIWFPRSVKHHYLSEHRKLDETSTFTLIGARFNVLPFPNVFDPSIVDSSESITNSREDLHSKVVSELPEIWTDFLALLPETGTTLAMFSDEPEIQRQMSPIAEKVAGEASVELLIIPRNANANSRWYTQYLLVKDRQVVDTRYGALTEAKLQEFVNEAAEWMTPRSTGVDENSLVRIDCYILLPAEKKGTQSGEVLPITTAVIAVHEDQALLLGPDSIAEYMEQGYACVAVVGDAASEQKQVLLEVMHSGPVKLHGKNLEPHKRQASVRITHSDGTSSELPLTSVIPDWESMPKPQEKYDVDMAIYRIGGVHGLKPVKLATIGETITVGDRVLSGSFSQKPFVPVVLGFGPPVQWQTQKVESIDGVYRSNMHGPETFDVLCPSLPVPCGFTFNKQGRLIGKYATGGPTHENMTHSVFKSHATHSILRSALFKLNDEGLKSALAQTLEESKSIHAEQEPRELVEDR